MIDKLDLRVPRRAEFTPSFQRLYRELRNMDRGPFHPARHYEFAGDLREYGIGVRLNLFCRMDKVGNHKLELIDVGDLTRGQIVREVSQVFQVSADALEVMRLDLAVDVPGLPVSWFRESVSVEHKRFRAAVTGEPFYSEMGNGQIQTLYFGKRPNLIRIYDKQAERMHQYRNLLRSLGREIVPPTFESVFGHALDDSALTRVERQMAGRIPENVSTLRKVFDQGTEFQPFERLKIIDHAAPYVPDSSVSFETRCTGMLLRNMAQHDGMQAVKTFVSAHSNGNVAWAWRKYGHFFSMESESCGITGAQLQQRYVESLTRQLAA